jgi:hypothetical protein
MTLLLGSVFGGGPEVDGGGAVGGWFRDVRASLGIGRNRRPGVEAPDWDRPVGAWFEADLSEVLDGFPVELCVFGGKGVKSSLPSGFILLMGLLSGLFGFVALDFVEELAGEGLAGFELFGLLVVVFGGDEAVGFLIDDVFDYVFEGYVVSSGLEWSRARLRWKGAERDLEAVEEHSGALQVDVVVGDGVHDLGDGGAGAVAVLGVGEVEDIDAVAAFAGIVYGAAVGVVVVTEVRVAQAGTAATAAGGEDVAAAAAGGLVFFVFVGLWVELFVGRHVGTPSRTFSRKVFERDGLALDFVLRLGLVAGRF